MNATRESGPSDQASLPHPRAWGRYRTQLMVGGLLGLTLLLKFLGVYEGWGMSPASQIALVVLVMAAVLWVSEVVPLFVTSILILFLSLVWLQPALVAAGDEVSRTDFTAPFFSDVVLLFLGGFVLAAGLHRFHIDEQMARWMLRKSRGSLSRLIAGLLGVTAFLSMWLSNTATAAMMLSLVLPIVRQFPEGSSKRKAILLAIPFAANIGGLGTPIGSPPNAIALDYMRRMGEGPAFETWMRAGVPLVIVLLAVLWVLLVYGYGARGQVEILSEERTLGRSMGRRLVLGTAVVTAAGWLTSEWHGLSTGTVALIPVIIFFGSGMLGVRDLKGLSWDVLLLMGGGLCLGAVLSHSGLAAWVVEGLDADRFGTYGIMVVFAVAACVISTVMSNTATANLMMPMILGLSVGEKGPILAAVAFACSLAMALPISTPPNAMAFSSGELKVGDILRPGLFFSALGVLLMLTVGYWWWGVVGFR